MACASVYIYAYHDMARVGAAVTAVLVPFLTVLMTRVSVHLAGRSISHSGKCGDT